MKRILGIDEAGRGPVIGPLVLAAVLIDESQSENLSQLGVKDSKQLSRRRRESLVPEILAIAHQFSRLAIPAEKLDGNLTQIELEGMAQLIRALRPDTVFLDAPVPPSGIAHYVSTLRSLAGDCGCELVAENKADEKYPVVGAASILAKVRRDQLVCALKAKYGDFGWGYPSEPKTQNFLVEWYAVHGTFPDIVRHRWRTVQQIIHHHKMQSFFAADDR